MASLSLLPLTIAPARIERGENLLPSLGPAIAALGRRPVVVGGEHSLALVRSDLAALDFPWHFTPYGPDCCESSLDRLNREVADHRGDLILGAGGGKALDTAKLLAHQTGLPCITLPTSGATCAAWTALSNIYSEAGAFLYDVSLQKCPDLLVLDYALIAQAPPRTLIAGIGDAIAKWYEASVSSGHSSDTLTVAAVQGARVLRDLLLQKSVAALGEVGGQTWREVVDATVLMAGVSGGLGGANCRTVAAHAVHNGLTQLPQAHHLLHGEKVAYGILVQLRLEEMIQGSQLASAARQQLWDFYGDLGLPHRLTDLGLGAVSLAQWQDIAHWICHPQSDIHRLPFPVTPELLLAAMVSTAGDRAMEPRS